ncbi:MAG: 50S ribosomal protein L22 [Fidelibacterota bacterium]
MEAKAITRFVRQSPRKVRVVINEVRGREVGDALNYLHFSPLKAAAHVEKTVRSAVANLLQKSEDSNLNPDSLHIKTCYVDGGPFLKRFRAASMGRISKLNKPTSHITIVVSDEKN